MSSGKSGSRPVVASGTTGSTCKKTGPYVYDNGFLKIIAVVKKGEPFPPAPTQSAPGDGPGHRADATWTMVRDKG